MYLISQLATKVGLSRTALLYYEKLGLIKGKRLSNGYRQYSERDMQRLLLIQQLQSAGLTLKECQACMDAKLDKKVLAQRLVTLNQEIEQKTQARDLLLGLLGERSQRDMHSVMSESAPEEHLHWLSQQGFDEKEALRIKWLSKDMNEHDQYMQDFMTVFETLDRWGPGSEAGTLDAISHLPDNTQTLLEIGCGKGTSTTLLAENTQAQITAVDNEPSAIEQLEQKLTSRDLDHRVTLVNASMTSLPFAPKSFDALWAEGCVYIMGMEKALKQWKPLLKESGVLIVSDLVWLTDTPQPKVEQFWLSDYPDIQTIATREAQFAKAGYELVAQFSLGVEAWQNYWLPLAERVKELTPVMPDSQALMDIKREIAIYEQAAAKDFTYQYFVLKKK
ncbi:MerR family transcriptional regulator [Vibrio sinaloensis]|uniref:MerR family transcriptional regulator n=1 Tax=Photobacterium sp. (strain ATCC 43367) TaxID=379097 RepID=UPI002064D9DF|nr:MerR family transcriptional regulator [Vibrio sinaloensis]UPQ90273.1 MerR family transcriptional regulator [Vibrio sinaloensis]